MTPIIDVHTHIFSALDIPLEGYLRSRRSERKVVEQILSFLGPLFFPYLANGMRERCITRKLGQGKKGFLYTLIVGLAKVLLREQYYDWEDTLSKEVKAIASEMVDTYKGTDLFVPLMIDYEYWFKNTQDYPLSCQIDYIYEYIVKPYEGRIHPFVPFDPARELAYREGMHNPDGEPEKHGSLNLVRDAIENRGFIGVKLYNAMGYKPFNNDTVDIQRERIAVRNEKMQYVFEGRSFDEVLAELYDYCIENEVPITTHCGMYGIESYPDASFDFGKAVYWREVLNQDAYKNLHLNLAHFGWYTPQGYHGDISWVRDICEMLSDYDYLFTDVSCHRVISDANNLKFKSHYKEICCDFPVVKKRLLYGSDWHVLKRVKYFRAFKERYLEVLKNEDLFSDAEIDDFLGWNALNFLGLLPNGKNRARLEKFYNDEGIKPPEWFRATSGT